MRLNTAHVYTTRVDGGTVMLDARTSEYLTTNEVGTFIVALLSTSEVDQEQIVSQVSEEYGVSESTAREDCAIFLESLRERELIEE